MNITCKLLPMTVQLSVKNESYDSIEKFEQFAITFLSFLPLDCPFQIGELIKLCTAELYTGQGITECTANRVISRK